jgi:hypothetical protein
MLQDPLNKHHHHQEILLLQQQLTPHHRRRIEVIAIAREITMIFMHWSAQGDLNTIINKIKAVLAQANENIMCIKKLQIAIFSSPFFFYQSVIMVFFI